jgi:3-deoxy-manno-octulosonate cytidylyltransferase (CMP-KDO synthetase)
MTKTNKIIGVVPARMASSRFPGKPLHMICGRPMVEHVFRRAALFARWDGLFLATCDPEIAALGNDRGWPTLMTSDKHTRALDRVAEAGRICGQPLNDADILICVQGDEPMLHPNMIEASSAPLEADPEALCAVLAMEIGDEDQFRNPDTVKIVHDMKGNVLYTSRSPVPYSKTFPSTPAPRRIYGILAFRWHFLQTFTAMPESPLELVESCDSNRICDNGFRQKIAPYPFTPSFSVDSPADTETVERYILQDSLWGKY